ncbi:TPA: rhamnulose-1-phosphate aldolase [Enterococcus faecalis]|uniref:rhamnulose-1-phosphate aldolase n=1 Tax=Enterococcus faecalis TaxID=1351 RepID=UPI00032E1FD1|nr:rhamnulose-1-phosphate aldolase [Enterococcus faecalis]EOF33073.1 rhamnulose-1-phosphate aldolase [Enterococcus faecalis EnGen0101]EOF43589.1 rhamnulose-1-phosphate aldolase [Enterococcus faecalis EnGen0101]EOF44809.1 rhamnulose-1-phosphate aldolase [Enterococcus faecalis EnGen0101]PQG27034.1 rhamnulose-1-phosphate aldolase [Enterococcus faecalis]UJQ88613.1 rhamnulose-1-phosphate aldolase [Enterococcus faecalis]
MTYPKYFIELVQTTYDMWQKGWDEYNGGNISYRLTESEVENLLEDFSDTSYQFYEKSIKIKNLMEVPEIVQGEYLLITASGSHFRYLKEQPEIDTGIVRLTENGYEIIAGYNTGKYPTSEIFMHILSHAARLSQNKEHRVVIHNHATNIVLYSLLNEVTSESLTKDLWSVLTESVVVFPDGISVLPWEVPGTHEIGVATGELLKDCRLVVWAKHGVLSTGTDFEDCFGLIETANKAAGLALELQRISGKSLKENNILSDDDLRAVCKALKVQGRYL